MIIVLVIIAGALTIGNCLGWGKGSGNGSGGGNGNGNGTGQETAATGEDSTDKNVEDDYKGDVYAITVSENDYFYDNAPFGAVNEVYLNKLLWLTRENLNKLGLPLVGLTTRSVTHKLKD